MEKLVVDDPVPGCPIGSVELQVVSTEMTFTGSTGESKTLPIRLMVPVAVDGRSDYMAYCITQILSETALQHGGEELVESIIQMLALYDLSLPFDRKRERQFDISTIDPSENERRPTPFDELRSALSIPDLTQLKFMDKIVSPVSGDFGQLLHDAFYESPIEYIPLSRPAYEEFREDFLKELEDARTAIAQCVRDTVNEAVERSPRQTRKKRKAELTAKALTIGSRQFRKILKRAYDHEVAIASKFDDLVTEARRLHDEVGVRLEERDLVGLTPDDVEHWMLFAACVQDHLHLPSVNVLIDALQGRLCQIYELKDGVPCMPWVDEEKDVTQPEREIATQQYASFNVLRRSADAMDKWDAICEILKTFVNRNECIRMLQREAEAEFLYFVDVVHRQIFRKIRNHLTKPERRLFLIQLCAMPRLQGRIVRLDPALESFFWGMDEETKGMIVLSLIHKIPIWENEDLSSELERRFRVYLRFYPYWVTVMREHEREKKQTIRYERKTVPFSKKVKMESGEEAELIDSLVDPRDVTMASYHHLISASPDMLKIWADKYCRPTDASRLVRYHSDELSQDDIAAQDGISQQWVSQSIRRGYRDLIKGLLSDKIIESPPDDL